MMRLLIGFALGLALAAAFVHASPSAISLDALARDVDHESDRVTAGQLAGWIRDRRPGLRIVDLRSDSEYAVSHIPAAEHLTVSALRRAGFRPNETIVLYSTGAGRAAQGWLFLRASGLEHVYALRGGMDEWAARRPFRGGC